MKNIDKVVILNQAAGYLHVDMLEAYKWKYSKRVIIAGSIVERNTPLSSDVKWHRVIKYNRSTSAKRIFTWMLSTIQMFLLVGLKYRKAHIVAITNPPLAVFIPWLLRAKSYDIVIYDAYPDALVNFGYINSGSLLYNLWNFLNKKTFRKANKIFTLTVGMKRLIEKVYGLQYLEVVPIWSDAGDFKPVLDDDNEILAKTNSKGQFCLVYSGNLGLTHPVEKLIDLAALLDPEKFSIIIIGDGAKEKLLREMQAQREYTHVHLLPWQPIELLSHSLHAADLSVVTLDKGASNISIPSKTFNILSVGNPILGICELNSGLAEVISENDCGIATDGQDLETLADWIIELEANKVLQDKLKANSLEASKKFTKENSLQYL